MTGEEHLQTKSTSWSTKKTREEWTHVVDQTLDQPAMPLLICHSVSDSPPISSTSPVFFHETAPTTDLCSSEYSNSHDCGDLARAWRLGKKKNIPHASPLLATKVRI